jgi:hypothetical protein
MMLAPSKAVLSGELETGSDANETGSDASETGSDASDSDASASSASDAPPESGKDADTGSNGHQNGAAAKTPEPSDAAA